MSGRTDYGKSADRYYDKIDDELQETAIALRQLIVSTLPKASESIKWGIPVYELDGVICAVRAYKSYIALQFFDVGIHLDDPDGLLEGTGKTARHVKIRNKKGLKKGLFKSWLKFSANHEG